jgi:hypothetical protein
MFGGKTGFSAKYQDFSHTIVPQQRSWEWHRSRVPRNQFGGRVQQGKWNKPRKAPAHVESCGVEALPPSLRALIHLQPGHYRLILFGALKRDGIG